MPGTWDEIRVPLARMNEHVTVARRSGSDWWVGSLNNGTERDLKLELDFLSEGDYQATIYTDAEDVERNPNNLDRQVRKVTRKDIIELNLARMEERYYISEGYKGDVYQLKLYFNQLLVC